MITEYAWPGNLRELKNTLETAAALTLDQSIGPDIFNNLLNLNRDEDYPRNLPVHLNKSAESLDREMIYRALIEIKKDLMELKDFAANAQRDNLNVNERIELKEVIALDKLERDAILNALEYTRGSKRKAAKLLKISERTLCRKIKEFEL